MKEAKSIIDLIKNAKRIVITSHKSPDGDSIGSSLGLLRFIQALGHKAIVCHPDPCPDFLNWVKEEDVIIDFESHPGDVKKQLSHADLIFALDYNGAGRLGNEMGELFTAAAGKKVMIDHHLNPDDFVDVAVSEPSVCSTSQLIVELIVASGNNHLINESMGNPLYLGIMTDTGSFRYSSVTSSTHELLALLLKSGVKQSDIHESTFDNNRLDKLKLRSYIIAERLEIMEKYGIAIISVTNKEKERFHHIKGDTEGLVNVALSIEGVKAAAFFVEGDDVIKISFRSKGDIAVNQLSADHFNGGGHKNAAGGASYLGLDETIEKFKSIVPNYF